MKTLKQETTTKDYFKDGVRTTESFIYYYDTEEERNAHLTEMHNKGYEDTGQVRKCFDLFNLEDYVWYGKYYKITEERRNDENV